MKPLNLITLFLSLAAAMIAFYALSAKPRQPEVANGSDPRALIVNVLQRPRWDGTQSFFTKHRNELAANIVVVHFLENKGVGIAFVRTAAGTNKLQFCQWMRKNDSGWDEVPYLSLHLSGNPFIAKWLAANDDWLREMESNKRAWEESSASVW